MRVFLLFLLLGFVFGKSGRYNVGHGGGFGNRIDLQPSIGVVPAVVQGVGPAIGQGVVPAVVQGVGPAVRQGGGHCHPSVVWRTEVQYSTVVIPTIVYNNNIQYLTHTSVRTQEVTTTVTSEVVSTRGNQGTQLRTITVTNTQTNTRTRFVTLSGEGGVLTRTREAIITRTQFETRTVTRNRPAGGVITRTVFSTQFLPQQIDSTIFRTEFITRTQQIPGQTRTLQSIEFSTVYSTMFQQGEDTTITRTIDRTRYVTRTINEGGQTQIITTTLVNTITSTVYSETFLNNQETRTVTRTEFTQAVSTVFRTQNSNQVNTQTRTETKEEVSSRVSTQIIPTTIWRQQIIPTIVQLPQHTQIRNIFSTLIQTQVIPGPVQTQYKTRFVFNTNFITSTVVKDLYKTITTTYKVPAKCYNAYGH